MIIICHQIINNSIRELRVMGSVIWKMINVFVEGIFIEWMSNSAVKCVLILVKMCRLTGVRFCVGKRQISSELVLCLPSNSPQPPLKHPSKVRAKSVSQAKNFHFSKVIYELLWSFFLKYANKTTLVQYNFIHNIISQQA